ncbi:Uncharacterised protein [Streptococcus pneumoniae]|nr:Uncharacterised protein [Streptococcus pneumoniae]
MHSFVAKGNAILLASPNVLSGSRIIIGTRFNHAPIATGTETNPPAEKITSGFVFLIKL